jgi:HAD superfamily hydrolase (TIGR01490 family)
VTAAGAPVAGPGRGRVAAVFDVDNTLIPGISSERLFIRYLIRRRHFGPRAAYRTLAVMLRYARLGPFHTVRQHRPYLRGWPVARLEALGGEAFATAIRPRLSGRGVARVREHQAAGHLTALLSGAPPFLLAPLARFLGIEQVIGTPLAVVDGAYTGDLAGNHPYGPEKAALARRFAKAHDVALAASYAYADHHTDLAFLALFGHPVCVNPSPALRRQAARRGWPVEEFR